METKRHGRFLRILIPGFVFQSVVIGGGYGTGAEIREYFLKKGLAGGLLGMAVTLMIWSVLCAVTFEFSRTFQTYDYKSMMNKLLGGAGILYEICYIVLLLLVLGVVTATAGSMAVSLTGGSKWIGVAILSIGTVALVIKGTAAIENVLTFWSYVLFGTLIETGTGFIKAVDDRIENTIAASGKPVPAWVRPGVAIGCVGLGIVVSTFGLVGLIAQGYGTITWGFFIFFVVPMLTIGVYKLAKHGKSN